MKYISILLLISLLSSCVKDIPLEERPYESNVTIEGLLEPGETLKIYIHNSIGFFDNAFFSEEAFITNAEVIINGSNLYLDSTYSDFWCRFNYFYTTGELVLENTKYNLEVKIDNKTYSSFTETAISDFQIDSLSYVYQYADRYGDISQGIRVYLQDHLGNDQYRFFMKRRVDENVIIEDNFEYSSTCLGDNTTIIEDVGRFIEFDSDYGDGESFSLVMEPSHSFVEGDTIYVQLQKLDSLSALYLNHIEDLKYFSLNPFVEPTTHQSQIDGAFGFFGSSKKSTNQLMIILPEASN